MELNTYDAGAEETETECTLPFVGLVNQGSTCYLNSVIQALFHLPSFRQAIYSMENPERDPITLALRNIFSLLHRAIPFVPTKELTEAFGWSTSDSWVQHDVHEMMQKLFDSLEIICKSTPQNNFIRDHFYGELTYITRTLDGEAYVACRREGFYDVELLVKNKETIYESLNQWAEPERIEGVSLDIREGGPSTIHTVERSQRFARLPPVLLIHPNRVEFCTETFELNTLRSKWMFPTSLDLEPYILTDTKEGEDQNVSCTVYELRSIVIHQGAAQSGHYLTYVRFNEQWVCFNDTLVSRVSEENVMRAAYGEDVDLFCRNLNERASLLVYVNRESVKTVLEENPVPAHIIAVAEGIVAERDRMWKERWESVTYQHISDPNDLIDILDGILDVETAASVTTVPLNSPTKSVHAAISEVIGQNPERIRVWSYENNFSSVMYAQLHDTARRCNYLFVEALPAEQVSMPETMTEEAFFAPVRLVRDASLVFHRLVHGREELRRLVEEWEGARCLVCGQNSSVREVCVSEVLAGSNLILCPISTSNDYVVELLRRRKHKSVEIVLFDHSNSECWTPVGSIRLDDDTTYTELQREVYQFLSNTSTRLPPSPDYIGFHCHENGFGSPSLAVVPAYLSETQETTLGQLLIHTGERVLYVEILPAPLQSLDTLRLVLFIGGNGARFTIYVEQRCYTLGELYILALEQTNLYLSSAFECVKRSLAMGCPNLRLLCVHSGRIVRVIEDTEDTVLESQGLFVIDVLSELKPGFSRVNVLFCDRRSGESYFGFPTNIAVSDTYEETGADITWRVAEKLFGMVGEDTEEVLGRWIVAVKGKSGTCRTLGRKDLLKKLVEELDGELDCIIVDRPRSMSLDNILDTAKNTEQSIIIRSTSAQDLATTAATNSRQASFWDLISMDV